MTSTDDSATTRRSKATGAALTGVLPPFPGIHPQPHQITEWIEAFADKSSGLGLQAVLAGNLPLRVQSLRNWPDSLTTIPKTVVDEASASRLYSLRVEAARMLRDNERNDEMIKVAVLEDKSDLFVLLTEPMRESTPMLRDALREQCKMGASEYYDGVKATGLVNASTRTRRS